MNTPTNSELREEILHLMASWESDPNVDNAIDQLEALINKQIIKARIDEMQHSLEHIPMRIGELVEYKADRLTQLRTTNYSKNSISSPNPTPTTLRGLLRELSDDSTWCLPDVIGAVRVDREKQNRHLDEATQSIQEQLKALLPKKKDATDGKDYMYSPEVKIAVANYNQAIDQIQKAIEEWAK